MTNVPETAPWSPPRTAVIHSRNGGPPAPSNSTRLALVAAAAFVVGALAARLLDWRSHAHPHD